MSLEAMTSAKNKIYYDVNPQKMNTEESKNNIENISLFSTNQAENTGNPKNPQVTQLAEQYSAEAEQKIQENEQQNQAIFDKVVKEANQKAVDEIKKICADTLRNPGGEHINIEGTALNGGKIGGFIGFIYNGLHTYSYLCDKVTYKAVVDGKETDKTHWTVLHYDGHIPISNDDFQDVLKSYISEKNYMGIAQALQKGDSKVLENDASNNPVMTVSKDDNGNVTFVCTKAASNCVITYKNEELGQTDTMPSDSKANSKIEQKADSKTDLQPAPFAIASGNSNTEVSKLQLNTLS